MPGAHHNKITQSNSQVIHTKKKDKFFFFFQIRDLNDLILKAI